MSVKVEFPELTAAQAEVQARKLEKARWMKAEVARGTSKEAVGRMLSPAITRQAVAKWLAWLDAEEAKTGSSDPLSGR